MDSAKGKTIIFDIETVGEDFNQLDELTKHVLTRRIKESAGSEQEIEDRIEVVRNSTGLSPLTGQIAAIGVLAADSDQGAVYYQAPGVTEEAAVEGGIKLVTMSEKEMLVNFWRVAGSCRTLVGFNSRSFDAFFLNIRSAVHGIRPSVDLMSNRYLKSQFNSVHHIDLLDQLRYYGAVAGGGLNLHLWCRALGIKSPKENGVDGSLVSQMFKDQRYKDIARYNIDDLLATRELFRIWDTLLNFQKV